MARTLSIGAQCTPKHRTRHARAAVPEFRLTASALFVANITPNYDAYRSRGDLRAYAALGHSVGVTFQQIQKYEKGANRVRASPRPREFRAC